MLVASGDQQLMRQGLYQLQAATQLQDRGFKIESFQTPVAGKIIRITIPIVAAAADGTKHAIYTQCEHWSSECIEELRTWIANLREESDLGVIVASRRPPPEPASAPEVSQWLHLPYDTLNTTDPPPAATATEEPVLPCLKEAKWIGRGDSVCRALWEKQASNFMPWVAIGYDRPHTFEFISTKQLPELNTTEEALHARALVALRARPAKWQPFELEVKGTPLKILVCTGDYFSAEHILDPEFMKEAQRILKAPGLLVGVPRRGFLMATAAGGENQLLLAFGAVSHPV